MKTILLLWILFCAIAMPAIGVLDDADLDKIRLIVKEEIKPIKEEIKPIKTDIGNLKTEVAWIRGKLEGIDKEFAGVNQRITHATNVSYGLIALIVAAIAIPQIIMLGGAEKIAPSKSRLKPSHRKSKR